jgi:hypothetical protein
MTTLAPLAALILGGIFAISGLVKAVAPRAFIDAVIDFDVLPTRASQIVVAILLISTELVVSAMLLGAVAVSMAALTASALFIVFLAVIANTLARRRQIPCHCFGAGDEPVSHITVLRLVLLLAASIIVGVGSANVTRIALWSSANVMLAGVIVLLASWALSSREVREMLDQCRSCGEHPNVASERAEGAH